MMKVGILAEHEAKYTEPALVDIRKKMDEEGCYAARKSALLEAAGVVRGLSFE